MNQITKARIQTALIVGFVSLGISFAVWLQTSHKKSAASQKLSQAEGEVGQLRRALESSRTDLKNANTALTKTTTGLTELESAIQSLSDKSASLNDDYTVWDEVVPEVQQSLAALVPRFASLRTDLAESQVLLERVSNRENESLEATRSSIARNALQNRAQTDEVTVYITNTGRKYHRAGCQYLRLSKISVNKADAISRGFGACSRCSP